MIKAKSDHSAFSEGNKMLVVDASDITRSEVYDNVDRKFSFINIKPLESQLSNSHFKTLSVSNKLFVFSDSNSYVKLNFYVHIVDEKGWVFEDYLLKNHFIFHTYWDFEKQPKT